MHGQTVHKEKRKKEKVLNKMYRALMLLGTHLNTKIIFHLALKLSF